MPRPPELAAGITAMTSISFFFEDLLENPLTMAAVILGVVPMVLGLFFLVQSPKLFRLIVRNLGRNRLRTALTCVAIMALVFMVTMIWTIVFALARFTQERDENFKLIITERWSQPTMMPLTHASYLNPESSNCILKSLTMREGRPLFPLVDLKDSTGKVVRKRFSKDFMTWSFYGGRLDQSQPPTKDNFIFFFVMDPDHIRSMMDDLQDFDEGLVRKMKENRKAVVVGPERLAALNKVVGERFKITGISYKGIDLEVEVIGTLPRGRYGESGIMNAKYFNSELDKYRVANKQPHPLDSRRLNLVWLRVPDKESYAHVAKVIEDSPYLASPQVKCETAAAGIGSFMAPYNDLLNGVKYGLVPVILVIMSLVIANAISIGVRERHQEIAVLKVLGFRPGQVLVLVLGESLLLGGLSGFLSAGLTFGIMNGLLGGVPFPVAFFPAFQIPIHAFWWGLATGCVTAFVGSFLPSWSARCIKVAEVFARVA
jgi:putative ABC transport system permease protein